MLGSRVGDSSHANPRHTWLSRLASLSCAALAVIGIAFCVWFQKTAQFPDGQRYTYGYRSHVPSVSQMRDIRASLKPDVFFTLGYSLLFVVCAIITWRFAVSRLSRNFGRLAFGAAVIVLVAGWLEDAGLYLSTARLPDPFEKFAITATATMAVISTCAMSFAVFSVPAAAIVLWLRGFARWQCRPERQGPYWWDRCWAQPTIPDVDSDMTKIEEWSWVNSYNVPGAPDVIKRRGGEPVQAICLSGGGVRSACVAMGALQEFSLAAAKPVTGVPCIGDTAHAAGSLIHQSAGADEHSPTPQSPITTSAQKLIDSVDYIISVSGGGYTAGARLLGCQNFPASKVLSGEQPAGTPASDRDSTRKLRLSERFQEGSVEFEHVRRHSSYIADSTPTMIRALLVVLKNLVASVITVFWLPVAMGFGTGYLLAWLPIAAIVPVPRKTSDGHQIGEDVIMARDNFLPSLVHNAAAWWAAGVFVAIAVALTARALSIERVDHSVNGERRRIRLMGAAWKALGFGGWVLVLTVVAPALMRLCQSVSITRYSHFGGTVGSLLGLQYLAAIVAMLWQRRTPAAKIGKTSWHGKLPPGVVPLLLVISTLALLAATWLIVFGAVAAGVFGYLTQGISGSLRPVAWLPVWLVVLGSLAVILLAADVTSLSLHPFYRARLALAFAVRRKVRPMSASGIEVCEALTYPADEPTWLHSYGQVEEGPQFVFSCAAAISGEGKPAPGLNAVSYVLTNRYIGGPDLGWLKTKELWQASPCRIKRDLTVEAAVAVSGAAFASTMGRQNKGRQTLFAISGARLGTWLPNPNYIALLVNDTEQQDRKVSSVVDELQTKHPPSGLDGRDAPSEGTTKALEPAPKFRQAGDEPNGGSAPRKNRDAPPKWLLRSLPTVRGFTYFFRELFSYHPIDASLVQVTDGGHYENLGLVEALRRRSRLIICIDGGGDTPPLLSGLADAMRLAQSELGVTIKLDDHGKYAVGNIAPGSGKPFSRRDALARLNDRITRGTVVRGTITYPAASGLPLDQRTGVLIFAKAVVWQSCPEWLLTYAANNDVYPHDSTSDQWFNEAQFEAYTELGRIIGRAAVEAYYAPPDDDPDSSGSVPSSQEEKEVAV